MLLSEQNLHFARLVADRAYIIEKGQIRFGGSMAELTADASLREQYLGRAAFPTRASARLSAEARVPKR